MRRAKKVGRLACCGIEAAETLLAKVHGINVSKALDPLDPDDFLVIVKRLADAMKAATAGAEAAALRAALVALDVDWPTLGVAEIDRIVEAARAALLPVTGQVLPSIIEQFEIRGPEVMAAAREGAVDRFGLNIATSLSLRDQQAEQYIRTAYSNMVTNAYGERIDALAASARDIVASGLENGLGRDDIANDLQELMGDALMRGRSYFQVVATSFMNTARTASLLNSYADAGIESYRFEAVMDEATTDQCRFYHDQVFSVSGGVAAMNATLRSGSLEELQNANPWIRVGRDDDGQFMYFERDGQQQVVARIESSGVGTQSAGTYSGGMSSAQLSANGIPWPPLHGNCRSTIVPAGPGF